MRRIATIATALCVTVALGFFAAASVASSTRAAADSTSSTTETTAPESSSASSTGETTGTDPTTSTDTETTATSTTAPATTATTAETTTAPETTAPPPTTTAPTTTVATTTAATTADPPPDPPTPAAADSTPATTVGGTAGGSNGSGVGQASNQAAGSNAPAPTTTPAAPPPSCSTGQLACGNNAANQIALVTQTCANVQQNTLDIDITTATGSPVQNVTVENGAVCMNISQIEQTIRQYCVNCTLVVQNFSSTTNDTTVTTVVNDTHTTVVEAATWGAYCMPKNDPILRGDGTVGWLVFLRTDQSTWDRRYAGATSAAWSAQNGYVCPGTAPPPLPATFTLTVPISLVGQYVNLCIQPADPTAKPVCHSVRIDAATTVTIPVTSNVTATVTKDPLGKPVSPQQLSHASGIYERALGCPKPAKAGKGKHRGSTCAKKTKKKAKARKHTTHHGKKGKR